MGGCFPSGLEAPAFLVTWSGRGSNEEMLGVRERAAAPPQPGPFDALVVLDDGTPHFGQREVAERGVHLGAAARGQGAQRARGVGCFGGVVSAGPDDPANFVDVPGHLAQLGREGLGDVVVLACAGQNARQPLADGQALAGVRGLRLTAMCSRIRAWTPAAGSA